MPEANANLYTRFKLKSEKLSKCKIGTLGSMARVSDFFDMLHIKPLNDLYHLLETKQQLSEEERKHYAKELYNVLASNELKDQEFATYYMRIDSELTVPYFDGGKKFTAFVERKIQASDPIKQCMAVLIKNLMNDTQKNVNYRRIFDQAVSMNFSQFALDLKRGSNIIIQQNQENSLIARHDLSFKKIDSNGQITFKSSPLAAHRGDNSTISTNGEIETLPYVLRDYICKKSGLDIETPDKAMRNLGKWPKVINEQINNEGIKEYEIETSDGSLKLGKLIFAEQVAKTDIQEYCKKYNLPVMSNYQAAEEKYKLLKQEIVDYKNQESSVRVDDSIEHLQTYLSLSDAELRHRVEGEIMQEYQLQQVELIAFIKLLKEDYNLPDQDISNFINIHHQGLLTGIQSGVLPEIFRADIHTKSPIANPSYAIGTTKLICDDNGIKTLKHTDTISYKDFHGNALENIAHLKTVIDFSDQGKSKTEVGYNRPPGMNNLKAIIYYQAQPYGQIEVKNNIPLEHAQHVSAFKQLIYIIANALSKIRKIFARASNDVEPKIEDKYFMKDNINQTSEAHKKSIEEISPIVKPIISKSVRENRETGRSL
ncbi:hypothetical protein NOVO_04880 [Rickettsiales bacterium Ac37b]|nr:hypothetical protein NOVO_04880 [Rickettsiales bacterium Ac37b]